jgi:CubicO group peptidase (beta-lactamase class C family)
MDERQPAGAERVRSYLGAVIRASKTPGIQYLVVDASGVRFEYDAGWADIRRRVPMDADTTLMAYSMSKTITAAAVLQQMEEGHIGLDTPAERYLDSFPYGSGVTVRHLLAHTSGAPNPIPLRWVHPAARHEGFDESAALAEVLRDHGRPFFEPGAQYAYSNIGYWLLGGIVERAARMAFPTYVDERILRPLGIVSRELGFAIVDPARHAAGYLEKYSFMNLVKGFLIDRELVGGHDGRWVEILSHYPNGPAFGGLVGTARGFGKFLQDQLREHSVLFTDQTRNLFYTAQRSRRGVPVPMTLGWHVGNLDDRRFFYKEGGGGGFHSLMRLYPDARIATIVMTNATGFEVARCLDAVDPEFLQL